MQGDATNVLFYGNNHPKLCELASRTQQHIQNKNYEDASTNMRLSIEYMCLQYVKEFAPDLYVENLSVKITELMNRKLISEEVATEWHDIRKLANQTGAHITEEPVDVEKVKSCYCKMDIIQNDFYGKFHFPSKKEIPAEFINARPQGQGQTQTHRAEMWQGVNLDEYRKRPDVESAYVVNGKLRVKFKGKPEAEVKAQHEKAKLENQKVQDRNKRFVIMVLIGLLVLSLSQSTLLGVGAGFAYYWFKIKPVT